MLRLLQKKLTPPELEFIKHLIFVFIAHTMLLVFLVISARGAQRMVVNIRTFQKADNVVIKWQSVKKHAVSSAVHHKVQAPEPVKKTKLAPVLKPTSKSLSLSGQFTKIDLGVKKKKKINSSYQVPQPPKTEPVIEPVKAQTQEPLVLSVHDYNEQQQTFEIVDAVRRWWQPPMGVHPDALCMIMVKVSSTGTCEEVVVQQSSGIPAYDISAKSAVIKSNFPKIMWGKQCVLQF